MSSTCIIPAIKTDHLAITIEFCNKESEEKGPGLWKLNCSLLHDEDYVDDFASKFPTWFAKGQRDLTDNRSIWEWIKYNIRAHAIQHSKKRAKEKKEIKTELENNYSKAQELYEADPSDTNAASLTIAKEKIVRIIL